MKTRRAIHNSLYFCYFSLMLVTGCCFFTPTSKFVKYKYEDIGIEFCKWEKDNFISKVIIYKNRPECIELGIQKEGIYTFDKVSLNTLNQLGFQFIENDYGIYYVKIKNSCLTINQNVDNPILYILDIHGENPFVLIYQSNIVFLPENLQKMKNQFGYKYQKFTFSFN